MADKKMDVNLYKFMYKVVVIGYLADNSGCRCPISSPRLLSGIALDALKEL